MHNFGINFSLMDDLISDGFVENLPFFSGKFIVFGIFGQIQLATQCTAGIHRWIKDHKALETPTGISRNHA